jgi:hypothetical protein
MIAEDAAAAYEIGDVPLKTRDIPLEIANLAVLSGTYPISIQIKKGSLRCRRLPLKGVADVA